MNSSSIPHPNMMVSTYAFLFYLNVSCIVCMHIHLCHIARARVLVATPTVVVINSLFSQWRGHSVVKPLILCESLSKQDVCARQGSYSPSCVSTLTFVYGSSNRLNQYVILLARPGDLNSYTTQTGTAQILLWQQTQLEEVVQDL